MGVLIGAVLTAVVAMWAAGVWAGFRRIFGSVSPRAARRPAVADHDRRQVNLHTQDGVDLVAWHYPGRLDAMIIVSWGYRNVTDESRRLCRALQREGFHVLAHAWRGTVEASRSGCTAGRRETMELRAAVDAATTILPSAPIGIIGLSIGGAVALRVAGDDQRIRAICVDSLLTSPRDWVHDRYAERIGPAAWLFTDAVLALAVVLRRANAWRVRPLKDLATLPPRPVFMITSASDQLVGPARQRRVRAAAQSPKQEWIVDASHCGGFFVARNTYARMVAEFFRGMASDGMSSDECADRPAATQASG